MAVVNPQALEVEDALSDIPSWKFRWVWPPADGWPSGSMRVTADVGMSPIHYPDLQRAIVLYCRLDWEGSAVEKGRWRADEVLRQFSIGASNFTRTGE